MISSPSLVLTHPRLPGVELHRGPRGGVLYLISVAKQLSPEDCVIAGDWIADVGREELAAAQR